MSDSSNLQGKKAISMLLINILQVVVQGITIIRLAALLAPAGYGVFCYSLAIGLFAMIFAGGGCDQVLIMFGSRHSDSRSELLGNAIVLRAGLSVLAVALMGWAGILIYGYGDYLLTFMLIGTALIISGFLHPVLTSFCRVCGIFEGPYLIMLAGKCGYLAYLCLVDITPDDCVKVAFGFLLVNATTTIFAYVRYLTPTALSFKRKSLSETFHYNKYFWLSQLLDQLFSRIDILLIQAMLGAAAVGVYSLGFRFVGVLLAIPSAIHLVLQPAFHRKASDIEHLNAIFFKTRRLMIELASFVLGGMLAVGGDVVVLLTSDDYAESVSIVSVISVYMIFNYVAYPYSMLAEAHRKVRERFLLRVLSVVITVMFSILLINRYGIMGAAYGALTGCIAFFVVLHFYFSRNESVWHILRACRPFACMLAALFACLLLSPHILSRARECMTLPSAVAWQWTAAAIKTTVFSAVFIVVGQSMNLFEFLVIGRSVDIVRMYAEPLMRRTGAKGGDSP
jgi:O-antigen/teichoic acid export membrane protein